MPILITILLGIFVLVSLLMILVILMQRPKSEGLGAAFGGGVTENIFGAQTTNVLTKITGWLAGIFFVLTFALSMLYAHQANTSGGLRKELEKNNAPVTAVPAPAAPAVGAPNTVTNPTPGMDQPGAAPSASVAPADLAVGVTAPAPAANTPAPAAANTPATKPTP